MLVHSPLALLWLPIHVASGRRDGPWLSVVAAISSAVCASLIPSLVVKVPIDWAETFSGYSTSELAGRNLFGVGGGRGVPDYLVLLLCKSF
jgi:hypothetical protein